MDPSVTDENDMLPQGVEPISSADFTEKNLRKLDRCEVGLSFQSLILDKNELSRLENVDSYGELYKLSAAENKLVRMYGVSRLVHLRVLNLSRNYIVAIEGLRELVHLRWLDLSRNKIKAAEHLTSNTSLEYVNLTNNCIATLADISNLNFLRTLLLDFNNLRVLGNTPNSLPRSLMKISVTNNSIADLNQVSSLGLITDLQEFSISNNPCVAMTGNAVGFDYRPFIVNWCQSLKLLDGFVTTSKESLKAEWLYSMGKGRHFQLGEHAELVDYLSNVCPLTNADSARSAEDAKLTRILSKRRQHQQQLLQELSTMTSSAPSNYSSLQKPSLLTEEGIDAHDGRDDDESPPIVILSPQEAPSDIPDKDLDSLESEIQVSLKADTQYVPVPETLLSPVHPPDDIMSMSCESVLPRWLQKSSIPRSYNRQSSKTDSPILRRPTQVQRTQRSNRPVSLSPSNRRPNSASSMDRPKKAYDISDESGTDSDVPPPSQLTLVKGVIQQRLDSGKIKPRQSKLQTGIQGATKTKAIPVPMDTRAATIIQATWRGYSARKRNPVADGVRREIRVRRAEDHVQDLMEKLADTRRELENEKKLRKLQMEAIRSLWNEVQEIQNSSTSSTKTHRLDETSAETSKMISNLATTCNILQAQVKDLQTALDIVSSKVIQRDQTGKVVPDDHPEMNGTQFH